MVTTIVSKTNLHIEELIKAYLKIADVVIFPIEWAQGDITASSCLEFSRSKEEIVPVDCLRGIHVLIWLHAEESIHFVLVLGLFHHQFNTLRIQHIHEHVK